MPNRKTGVDAQAGPGTRRIADRSRRALAWRYSGGARSLLARPGGPTEWADGVSLHPAGVDGCDRGHPRRRQGRTGRARAVLVDRRTKFTRPRRTAERRIDRDSKDHSARAGDGRDLPVPGIQDVLSGGGAGCRPAACFCSLPADPWTGDAYRALAAPHPETFYDGPDTLRVHVGTHLSRRHITGEFAMSDHTTSIGPPSASRATLAYPTKGRFEVSVTA